MRNLLIGSILLSLAGSIWGAMFIAVRLTVGVITPVALVWLRYGVALIPLLFLIYQQKVSWKIERKDWKLLLLSALTGNTLSIVTQESDFHHSRFCPLEQGPYLYGCLHRRPVHVLSARRGYAVRLFSAGRGHHQLLCPGILPHRHRRYTGHAWRQHHCRSESIAPVKYARSSSPGARAFASSLKFIQVFYKDIVYPRTASGIGGFWATFNTHYGNQIS